MVAIAHTQIFLSLYESLFSGQAADELFKLSRSDMCFPVVDNTKIEADYLG